MNLYIFALIILTFFLVFLLPSYLVYKKTKINPITFGKEDTAHNFVGKIFKILMGLILLVATFKVFFFEPYSAYLVPIHFLETETISIIGVVFLHLSIIWVLIAQYQMGKSWRIGIDEKNATKLVTNGLFSISRNPIFLGMIVFTFSFFLIFPNVISFFTAFCSWIVIQIQIRLEEEFLQKKLDEEYLHYKLKTRRLI